MPPFKLRRPDTDRIQNQVDPPLILHLCTDWFPFISVVHCFKSNGKTIMVIAINHQYHCKRVLFSSDLIAGGQHQCHLHHQIATNHHRPSTINHQASSITNNKTSINHQSSIRSTSIKSINHEQGKRASSWPKRRRRRRGEHCRLPRNPGEQHFWLSFATMITVRIRPQRRPCLTYDFNDDRDS